MTRSSDKPAISVVMPVHNALPYLDEAVKSILDQTKRDFEFVVYDDASTDGSWERLERWAGKDERIKLFRGKRNLGPAKSSNAVVRRASAPLIARMDADDISRPDRLEVQSRVLAQNTDVGIVGSLCDVIDSGGRKLSGPEPWRLVRASWFKPFPHGSMMFRRELFDSIGGYRAECEFWEDLDFALRAVERTRILVIPAPLYRLRHSDTGTRLSSEQTRVENALDLRYRAIERLRQGRSYDDLLQDGRGANRERVDPRVFLSLALLQLRAGRRPTVAKRLFKRANLGFDLHSLTALAGVLGATLSPALLRAWLSLWSRVLNAGPRSRQTFSEPVEWRTRRRPSSPAKSKQGLSSG